MIRVPAPAKLNLFLHITGRRDNGYHELQSIFQLIDLQDWLEFRPKNNDISIRFKYAFKWQQKVAWFACGTYPDTDMLTIRQIRDEAKNTVSKGIDPRLKKRLIKSLPKMKPWQLLPRHKS